MPTNNTTSTTEIVDDEMCRPMVDLTPICFRGTFSNPCFWLLLGISGTLAVQYIFQRQKGSK
jgi:hypothetical protein